MKRKMKCFIVSPDGFMRRVKGILKDRTFLSKQGNFDIDPANRILYRRRTTYLFNSENTKSISLPEGIITKYSPEAYKNVFNSRIVEKLIDALGGGSISTETIIMICVGLLVIVAGVLSYIGNRNLLEELLIIKERLGIFE
ncbi:MAG: hypothetical protein PHS68_05765 [Candidatus Izemoplasmatales bacterium]|nr:hypothetical protein [Candidatus Izemoplasmatales bacterium]